MSKTTFTPNTESAAMFFRIRLNAFNVNTVILKNLGEQAIASAGNPWENRAGF